uniref:Uncharacterized protein n=1 Tax=Romanomermis culicivorax TaxID=13658 RepID=A0A915I991_ROMCU
MSHFFDADLQLLMNQLRQNEANSFTWEELAKLAKTNFMEKRNPLDSEDRSRIQRGLEFLKRDLKVYNYKDLCDVLLSICARVNLKFCVAPVSACGDLIPVAAGSQLLSISNSNENFGVKIFPCSSTNNEKLVEKVQLFFPDKSCHGLNTLCKLLNQRTLNPTEEYLSNLSSKFSFNDQKDANLHVFQALKSLEHQLESYDKKVILHYRKVLKGFLGGVGAVPPLANVGVGLTISTRAEQKWPGSGAMDWLKP